MTHYIILINEKFRPFPSIMYSLLNTAESDKDGIINISYQGVLATVFVPICSIAMRKT